MASSVTSTVSFDRMAKRSSPRRTSHVTVRFADIYDLLVGLGFRHYVLDDQYGHPVEVFDDRATDSTVAIQKPVRGRVPALYVSAVSRMLDERGFRPRAQVEHELLAHASDRRSARHTPAVTQA